MRSFLFVRYIFLQHSNYGYLNSTNKIVTVTDPLLSQVQAVLSGSLRQETSLVLVLIALERYLAQVDFDLHLAVFSPGLTLLYILASLASSVILYSAIVFLRSGFYLSTSSFSVSLENRSGGKYEDCLRCVSHITSQSRS